MTNEELEQVYDCLDGGFGETSGKLSAHIKALEAENERLKVEYQNAQKVAKAKADSAVIALQMQALKQQNGKEYLMLKYIEKWDGKLPQVSNGNALVLPKIE